MKRLAPFLIAIVLMACGGGRDAPAPQGDIDQIVIVMQGDEPLPFDPRGSRLTVVSRELARVLGHPLTLELEAALSPAYKASLEEALIRSLEELTREVVHLKKEVPDAFAAAAKLSRIVCRYDAVAKHSRGTLKDDGRTIEVFAPPNSYPLLERGVVSEALYDALLADAEKRYGGLDPVRVPVEEREIYFTYLTRTRPGYGYLYVYHRKGRSSDAVRLELVSKVVRLTSVLGAGSPLEAKARRFLLEHAVFVSEHGKEDSRVQQAYVGWLTSNVERFSDEDKLTLAKLVYERSSTCGPDCPPDAVLPGFDAFAFGIGVVDAWARAGHPVDPPPLAKAVVCPAKRTTDANTEIHYGCSAFFARSLATDVDRKRLADVVLQRRDPKIAEAVVLNPAARGGENVLLFTELLSRDDALFRHAVRVMLDDLARRDDVQHALGDVALRWWRDRPDRRGLALYLVARKNAHLDFHYSDNQWARLVPEIGGPVSKDVFAAYLAEGPRAVELVPQVWPALEKGGWRGELFARSLPRLLERTPETRGDARTARAAATLGLLRKRLCADRDAAAMSAIRSEIVRWSREHPEDATALSNAATDLTVDKCPKAAKEGVAGEK